MKHRITITLVFFCLTVLAQAQGQSKNNAMFLELGKTGVMYNLGFDHRIANKSVGLRMTLGSNFGSNVNAFSTLGGAYYLFGQKNNHLEFGVDIGYLKTDEISDDQFALFYPDFSISTFYTSMNIGYRRYGQKTVFRIGISPGFIKTGSIRGGYISYGFTFN